MKALILDSIGKLDLCIWLLVIAFFCGSATLFNGDLQMAFLGASGIIVEMLIIGITIEIIIETLKDTKGIGTITGFITNGPEALCLIVGLIVGDLIFAASTPLGSNFMNPVMLLVASLVCGTFFITWTTKKLYTWSTIIVTAFMAGLFFFIDSSSYYIWLLAAVLISSALFFLRPREEAEQMESERDYTPSKLWLLSSIIILTGAGYFLDSVVSFTAEHSHTPKGLIGFLVLATLTSWPEFKSCLSLLSRGKNLAAILNITVSNITNIWLAAAGILAYLTKG